MKHNMDKVRLHYVFRGAVQGVGFRYRAYHSARMFGVTGYVKNMPDGAVEMEAEGSMASIGAMVDKIRSSMFIDIESFECDDVPVQNSASFEIVG